MEGIVPPEIEIRVMGDSAICQAERILSNQKARDSKNIGPKGSAFFTRRSLKVELDTRSHLQRP